MFRYLNQLEGYGKQVPKFVILHWIAVFTTLLERDSFVDNVTGDVLSYRKYHSIIFFKRTGDD
jgi:hypothetical protein